MITDLFQWAEGREQSTPDDDFDPTTYTRKVSNVVYQQVLQSGMLSRLRQLVYSYVHEYGPCCQTMAQFHLVPHQLNCSTIRGRFSELVRMDAIEIVGKHLDPIGNRHVVTWYDVTGRHPVTLEKPTHRCPHCGGIIDDKHKLIAQRV